MQTRVIIIKTYKDEKIVKLKYYENGKSQEKEKEKDKRKNVYRNDMTLNYYIAHDCI